LLPALLCFTVLPSFTILDEDITIPETEINVELEEFVTELKAELNRITTELMYQLKIEELLAEINMANPSGAIWVYNDSGCGTGKASQTFSWLNTQENIDALCSAGTSGQASYKYQTGEQTCHPVTCSL